MSDHRLIQSHQLVPAGFDFDYRGTGLDMTVLPSQIHCIIGAAYTGKRRWLRTLCGLDPAHSGRLSLMGHEVADMNEPQWQQTRCQIAYIPFNFSLFSASNVRQNLLLAPRYHQLAPLPALQDRADHLLNRLDPQLDTGELPAYLRKDQQCKVAIARALMLKPRVLVFDNLFAYFDPDSRLKMENFLLEEVEGGLSLLLITHDLRFAIDHGDHFILADRDAVHTFDSKQAMMDSDVAALRRYLEITGSRQG